MFNKLRHPLKSKFCPDHSRVTALEKVTDDIRLPLNDKCVIVIVFHNFSNAFNPVNWDVLLGEFRSLNYSSSAKVWFDSYLRKRSQRINDNDSFPSWTNLVTLVSQGGVFRICYFLCLLITFLRIFFIIFIYTLIIFNSIDTRIYQ